MTPETSNFIESGRRRREKARARRTTRSSPACASVARETGVWLLIGSLVIDPSGEPGAAAGETRLANRSFLVDPGGAIVARYDKIHMFDIDLPGGESYRESNAYRPGGGTVVAETPWGRLGMTVCYDLRFPHLYRALAQAGADFLAIPSVFTVPTGKAHWHVLLRARAIENGCFVFAPAQWGEHADGQAELWPLADRRSVGRGARRCRRGRRHRQRPASSWRDRQGAPHGPVASARPAFTKPELGRPLAAE